MSLKSLVNDPQFSSLSPDDQKQAIVSVEPEAAKLPPQDYSTFVDSLKTTLPQSTGAQNSGPVVSPGGFLNAITPTKEQLPEIIGTTLGGMAAGIPGAIAGGMAGVRFKQAGQASGLLKGTPPKTIGEARADTAIGGAKAGLQELGGMAVSKAFSPFAKAFTPEAAAAKTAAETAGIEIPLGNLTQSKPLQVAERALEYTPFGQAITRQRKLALEGLKNYTDTIAGKLGVNRPPEVTGNYAKQVLAELPAKYEQTTDALYDAVMPVINKANPKVDLNTTIRTLDDILARRSGDLEPGGLKMLRDLRESLIPKASDVGRSGGRYIPATSDVLAETEVGRASGKYIPAKQEIVQNGIPGLAVPEVVKSEPGKFISGSEGSLKVPTHASGMAYPKPDVVKESFPGKYIGGNEGAPRVATGVPGMLYPEPQGSVSTFEQLKRLRTNLGQRTKFNDPAASGLAEDLKQLYGAMTEDLNNTVKTVSKSAYEDLQAASAKYAEGKQLIGSSLYKHILTAKPENVYKLVIVPGSPSQAELGKEILGDSFKDVTRQWFDDIVRKSSPTGTLSPALFSKWLKSYEAVIPEITSGNPALVAEFKKLGQISGAMAGRGNEAVSGSQTAYALGSYGPIIATISSLLGGNFKQAAVDAGMIGATGLGVAGIKSGVGRELLTRGYPRVGAVAGRAAQVGGSVGLAKLLEERIQK